MVTPKSFNVYNPETGEYEEVKVSTKFTDIKNVVVLGEDSSFVDIGIPAFNPIEDTLEVVKNTVKIDEDIDYILNGGYLRIENPSGLWKKDTTFSFKALKNVDRSPLPSYDPSLFQDGGFTKAKFAQEIQDELNSIPEIKTSLAENVQQLGEHTTQINNLDNNKANKDEVNTLATEKANKIDLVAERARIDLLVAPPAGVDNAETADIRVGIDGTTYASAGEAIRTQFNNLKGDKVSNMDIGQFIAGEEFYDINEDFSLYSTTVADSNRYTSNGKVGTIGFLKEIEVKTGMATSVIVKAATLDVNNNNITITHDYGEFTLTNGVATINDRTHLLSNDEYIFIRHTGGFYYRSHSVPEDKKMVWLLADLTYQQSTSQVIAYKVKLEKATISLDDIKRIAKNWFYGKTYVAYGDSITAGFNLENYVESQQFVNTSVEVYAKLIADELGMNYYNFGYSAHGFACPPSYTFSYLLERHHIPADIVTVLMGTNDYGLASTYNIPFGQVGDTDETTFCGAVKCSFDKLTEYYPNALIIIFLPLPRKIMTSNVLGKTLFYYADAIKQIAQNYNFPVVDLTRNARSNIKSTVFMDKYSLDGLHWNLAYHEKYLKPLVQKAIEEYVIEN